MTVPLSSWSVCPSRQSAVQRLPGVLSTVGRDDLTVERQSVGTLQVRS